MTAVISMLRGINVGGHKRIRMEDLRALYEASGLADPKTYVQSGNVIFRTKEKDLAKLARKLEAAIEKKFGFPSGVYCRTAGEMRNVIARNPFAHRPEVENNRLLVTFLADDPGAKARARIEALEWKPEEMHLSGRELYVYFPNGAGQSKLTGAVLDKALGIQGTARNWNSVVKMLAMADELEAT